MAATDTPTDASGTSDESPAATYKEIFPRAYVAQILTKEECKALLDRFPDSDYESLEGEYMPSYRSGSRVIFDDTKLAEDLFRRTLRAIPVLRKPVRVTTQGCIGHPMWFTGPEEDGDWVPHSLNNRFRLNRTVAGQHFARHRDGMYDMVPPDVMGRMTFLLYLTDVKVEHGGATLFFYDEHLGRTKRGKTMRKDPRRHTDHDPSAKLQPRAGQVLVFDHGIVHAGEPVGGGDKRVMRTDVEFCRVGMEEATGAVSLNPPTETATASSSASSSSSTTTTATEDEETKTAATTLGDESSSAADATSAGSSASQ